MEIKQLEYFVTASECESFNKAAECLYTSQPNVSKVISGLEKELGKKLFERTSKGIQLTPFGETVRDYARDILRNVLMISNIAPANPGEKLSVSTWPSILISRFLVDFYNQMEKKYVIEHLEGTAEEITDHVKTGAAQLGLVFIAKKQLTAFHHILGHKKLDFEPLDNRKLCVYAGKNHPLYERESIDFSLLSQLEFIRGARDYFSMEHHLESVIMACEPDVIFIGGRLSASYDSLNDIAPVIYLSTDTEAGVVESVRKMPRPSLPFLEKKIRWIL